MQNFTAQLLSSIVLIRLYVYFLQLDFNIILENGIKVEENVSHNILRPIL